MFWLHSSLLQILPEPPPIHSSANIVTTFLPYLSSPTWVAYIFFYVQTSTEVQSTYQGQWSSRISSLSQQLSIANTQLAMGLCDHLLDTVWVCIQLMYAVTISISSYVQFPCCFQMVMFLCIHSYSLAHREFLLTSSTVIHETWKGSDIDVPLWPVNFVNSYFLHSVPL